MGKSKTSFKAGNLAAEKWTEEIALDLANDLIEWMKKEESNIFYEDFLFIEKDLYSDLIVYLSNKFPKSFALKIKRTPFDLAISCSYCDAGIFVCDPL